MAKLTTEERVKRGMELLSWEYDASDHATPPRSLSRVRGGKPLIIGSVALLAVGAIVLLLVFTRTCSEALSLLVYPVFGTAAILWCGVGSWRRDHDRGLPLRAQFTSTGLEIKAKTEDRLINEHCSWNEASSASVDSNGDLTIRLHTWDEVRIPIPHRLRKDVEELCAKLNDMIAGRKGERVLNPEPSNNMKSTLP